MKQDLSKLAVSEYYALDKSTGNYIPIASKLALHYEIQNKELLKKRKTPQFEIIRRSELVDLITDTSALAEAYNKFGLSDSESEKAINTLVKKPRGFQKKKV